ncbi:MAG: spore cortex biosynthesis protein YabQ [Oscillospiraceae bacterium]
MELLARLVRETPRPEVTFGVAMETRLFLWSCVLGFALGAAYDCLRVFRILIPQGKRLAGKLAVAAQDVLFFLAGGAGYYLFVSELAWGQLRLFILGGILLGFFTEHFTIGNLLTGALRAVVGWLFRKLFYPVMKLITAAFRILNNRTVKILLNFMKKQKTERKRLKVEKSMVYNNHVSNDITKKRKTGGRGNRKKRSSGKQARIIG